MEPGEGFFVEFWDGDVWQIIANYVSGEHFENDSFYQITDEDLIIDRQAYTFPKNAKFKFRCHASDSDDDIYIDQIRISAINTSLPGTATNPSPAKDTSDVAVNITLSWTAGDDAASHNLYLGDSNPPEFIINQTGTRYDPDKPLDNNKTYYWRIDEVNANGITTGPLWSFKTVAAAPDPAGKPFPAHKAVELAIDTNLSWTAGARAASHNVYFGTRSPGVLRGNQTETIFDPGILKDGTAYYWRIDEVNAGGTTTGTVWSFTTMAAPAQAENTFPEDEAVDIMLHNNNLNWTAGNGAASHDVYFGTSNPPVFLLNQFENTFNPGVLSQNTTYYWRIDEVNAGGTTTGVVWSFTTIAAPASATNPSPANSAVNIAINVTLNWTADKEATSHNVYFGTSDPPQFVGNQIQTAFKPVKLNHDTIYYWRIDEVNSGGTTVGTVWSFTTIIAAPDTATKPTPTNGTVNVPIDVALNWTAGARASSHDVYFGTTNPPVFIGNQSDTTYNPTLTGNKTVHPVNA